MVWLAGLLLLALLAPESGQCDSAATMDISGHVKSLNVRVEPSAQLETGTYSSTQLWINAQGDVRPGLAYDVAAENTLIYAEHSLEAVHDHLRASINRRLQLDATQRDTANSQARFDMDRLSLKGGSESTEWTLGRQPLGFGRMTMVSPLDVVAPFSAVAIDTEVRPGVDAVRLTHYFGLGGQIGAAMVTGNVNANNSYLAMASHNIDEVDLLAIGGTLRERAMLGLGVGTDVGGLGLKAEAVAYKGRDSEAHGQDLYPEFLIGAAEAWYRFENGLTVQTEYLYNGAGAHSPDRYADAARSAAVQEGLTSLLGQHYLLFGPSYELHPLVNLKGLAIWNMRDDSLFLRPMVEISVTDNLNMQVFWAIACGDAPSDSTLPWLPPSANSEFGSVNDYGGINLTYYF